MSAPNSSRPDKMRSARGTTVRPRRRRTQPSAGDDYQVLFQSSPSPMYILDAGTLRFVAVNEAAEKQCGWTKAEFLRMTARDMCVTKEARRLCAALKARLRSEVVSGGPWHHRRKDGSLFDAEVSVRSIKFAGRPARLVLVTDVTRHKRAEEALRESQERLRLAQDAARIGTFDWDIVSGKVLWSPETERIWGLHKGEFRQTYAHWRKLVHPADLPQAEALAQKAVRDPKVPYAFEHRIICPSGAVRWIFAKATTIRNASGRAVRMVGLNMDITARKQADEELRQLNATLEQRVAERTVELQKSMAILQGFYDSAPFHMGIAELADDRIVVVSGNRAVANFLRKSAADLVGKHGMELGTPRAILELWIRNCRRSRRQRKPLQFDYEYPQIGSGSRWLRATVAFIGLGFNGHPRFSFVVEDITQRKQTGETARKNEQRLRLALRAARMVTWEWDIPAGAIRYSTNTPEVVGGEAIEPYCSISSLIQQIHPKERAAFTQALQQTINEGVPFECEYRVKMLDGAYRWISGKGDVVERRGGKPIRAMGISQDITERKMAEQALEQANSNLRRLGHRLTQVEEQERRRLAHVLHEGLQQLLVSAMFHVSDIENKAGERSMRRRIAKVAEILDECVNVTRTVTYASYPPALHDLGIGAALDWLCQYCKKNLKLSIDLKVEKALQVQSEECKICLFRAAQELLLNIAKHARVKRAGVRLWRTRSGELRLDVSDKGAGFDPAALQVSQSGNKGFGLFGLRERAAMLGGRLEIHSAPGAGTKVSFRLPGPVKAT